MNPRTLLSQARDVMTVRQVFGEPIERDGVTVIPVAKVMGGGGGGEGGGTSEGDVSEEASGTGGLAASGGGFGFRAVPLGVYTIKDGEVTWKPALNVNRVILGGQFVGVFFILVTGWVMRKYLGRRRG
jgi:uncharacterized spore protein YtfJ